MRKTVFKFLRKSLADNVGGKCDLENITEETSLHEVMLDNEDNTSRIGNLVNVADDIEREFGIEFTDDELLSFRKLGDFVSAVEKKKVAAKE